jgi:two-component system KDP operon response regulator KdpE
VLVVEDDETLRELITDLLEGAGYVSHGIADGASALDAIAAGGVDLVLLDRNIPEIDGLEVCRRARASGGDDYLPIIMLTALASEAQRREGFAAGADDYVSKPFAVGELLARVRVALRHAAAGESGEPTFMVGGLRVDQIKRQVQVDGRDVHLTPIEYRLLTLLARHAGRVISQRQLLKEVWGPGHTEQAHYLRVYMGTLRRKLEQDPARPRYLLTEPGVGYRLAAE